MKPLDLDAVQTFALVADLGSFTRAAEASGATQSAVSLKLKRLEAHLERRLIERTPRSVRLTSEGTAFLPHARDLLAANQRALAATIQKQTPRLSIGISDHAAGPELPSLLAQVNGFDPGLAIEVTIGYSRSLLDDYDRKRFDAVIARKEGSRRDGEMLVEDEFGWFAAPSFRHRAGDTLRLAMLTPPCGVRALAVRALDSARIDWTEVFSGGGVTAVASAIHDRAQLYARSPPPSAAMHNVADQIIVRTENFAPGRRCASMSCVPSVRSTPSTCADHGPLRQASIIIATSSSSPAKTASTVPSRKFRTQPSTPRMAASSSTKAR
jgi:DNA-binding transcriptional LysR family regulator